MRSCFPILSFLFECLQEATLRDRGGFCISDISLRGLYGAEFLNLISVFFCFPHISSVFPPFSYLKEWSEMVSA